MQFYETSSGFTAADYTRIFGTEDELFDPIGAAERRRTLLTSDCTSASDDATIVDLPDKPTPLGAEPSGVVDEDQAMDKIAGPVPTSIAKRPRKSNQAPKVSGECGLQFFRYGRWHTCTLPRLHKSICSDSPPLSAA